MKESSSKEFSNEINVVEIMRQIRAEADKLEDIDFPEVKPSGVSANNDAVTYLPDKGGDNRVLDLNELLGYDGDAFVENAYLKILGRYPDYSGKEGYLQALESGKYRKSEILRGMVNSPEGKARGVSIPGLDKKWRSDKIKKYLVRIPLIGGVGKYIYNLLIINRKLAILTEQVNRSIRNLEDGHNSNAARLSDIDDLKAKLRESEKNTIDQAGEIRNLRAENENYLRRIKELENTIDSIDASLTSVSDTANRNIVDRIIENGEDVTRLKSRMNSEATVWGDKSRLHISPLAAVFNEVLLNVNSGEITIGDYTFAGSNVSILAGSHDMRLRGLLRRDVEITEGCDIIIGKGVWLCSSTTILGPCTIGDNAVIAAGSVVVPGTIVPPNTVYGGIPAKEIKKLESYDDNRYDSEAVMEALERNDGVLFAEGWSEKQFIRHDDIDFQGHWLVKNGYIMTSKKEVNLHYYVIPDVKLEAVINVNEKVYDTLELCGTGEINIQFTDGNINHVNMDVDKYGRNLFVSVL